MDVLSLSYQCGCTQGESSGDPSPFETCDCREAFEAGFLACREIAVDLVDACTGEVDQRGSTFTEGWDLLSHIQSLGDGPAPEKEH